mmetsp:Transcript_27239/g.66120  ORF Transcript_27239/g.66120 Transcript_27239/m.66120 type:complete len:180 (-) Transcript_27239:339-878(-)
MSKFLQYGIQIPAHWNALGKLYDCNTICDQQRLWSTCSQSSVRNTIAPSVRRLLPPVAITAYCRRKELIFFGNKSESIHSRRIMGDDGSSRRRNSNMENEWQVLPSDGKLFHEMARPQFPELCYLPEDPRGDRARRLAESDISEEAAEKACANLKDELDRKDCVYDILATQDMDMVGAY